MTKPPRILVISSIFPPMRGPEGDHIMHLCRKFEEHGYEVHLLTSTVAETGGNPRYYNIIEEWGWRALPKIIRVIRRVKTGCGSIDVHGMDVQKSPDDHAAAIDRTLDQS